jgi:hypothetical protein
MMRRNVIMVLALLSAAACSESTGSEPVALSQASVELDAFSGLPNPVWEMTPAEARDVEARLRNLAPTADTLPMTRLGYRGFYIRGTDGRELYVTHGLIAVMESGRATQVYRDVADAESALKRQARARSYGSIVDVR